MEYKLEVHKITEWKDGCIYKTKKIKEIWLPVKPRLTAEENEIAKLHGGDFLASTTEYQQRG